MLKSKGANALQHSIAFLMVSAGASAITAFAVSMLAFAAAADPSVYAAALSSSLLLSLAALAIFMDVRAVERNTKICSSK